MNNENGYIKVNSAGSVDIPMIVCCLALVVIGLASIYSTTYDGGSSIFFRRQLIWAICGMVGLTVMIFISPRTLESVSLLFYIVMIGFLVMVPFAGKTVAGTTAWLELGPVSFQPSELAKVSTILLLSLFLAKNSKKINSLKTISVAAFIVILPMALVLAQADVGSSLIYFLMFIPVIFWAGASPLVVIILITPFIVALAGLMGTTALILALGSLLIVLVLLREDKMLSAVVFGINSAVGVTVQLLYERLAPHQQSRIANFLDPGSDPLGVGYNVMQSKVAIGSGGLLGKGFLNGTQTQLNFIPAQWTDFIFCVPGEEFGFIGAAGVLVLMSIIMIRGIRVASIVKNKYASLATIGFIGILLFHTTINVGMTIGLTPVIGIPLPFLSYGGSALFSYMLMIGIINSFYYRRKEYH